MYITLLILPTVLLLKDGKKYVYMYSKIRGVESTPTVLFCAQLE